MNRNNRSIKLRRLPHVFSKVLELPFRYDADVSVKDTPAAIRFVAKIDNLNIAAAALDRVRAHAVEIHPGVTKVVIRNGEMGDLVSNQRKVDLWRFRLPPLALPEFATAVFVGGELTVTVPKRGGNRDLAEKVGIFGDRDGSRLVIIQ